MFVCVPLRAFSRALSWFSVVLCVLACFCVFSRCFVRVCMCAFFCAFFYVHSSALRAILCAF